MKPHGTYKIAHRRSPAGESFPRLLSSREIDADPLLGPILGGRERLERILESLRSEIIEGGDGNIRVRQIFREPREIYRLEIELPELGYLRTTLLDREALEELLEVDEVREIIHTAASSE
jgi:hypothetical protein